MKARRVGTAVSVGFEAKVFADANEEEVVEGHGVSQRRRRESGVGQKRRPGRTPHAATVRRRPLAPEHPRVLQAGEFCQCHMA